MLSVKQKSLAMYAKIALTGGVVLGLELVSSKIMTPFFGVSINVWSSILAVTLVALAIGYRAGGYLTGRMSRNGTLLYFISAGTLASLWMNVTLWSYPFVFGELSGMSLVSGSILACLFTIFIPLLVLSSLNPALVALLNNDAEAKEKSSGDYGSGTVLFVSTLGSVAGVFIVTYLMMSNFTNYDTLALLSITCSGASLLMLMVFRMKGSRAYMASIVLTGLTLLIAVATIFTGGLGSTSGSFNFAGRKWQITHSQPSYFSSIKVADIDTRARLKMRLLITEGLIQNSAMISPHGGIIPFDLYTYVLERTAISAMPSASNALVLGLGAGVIPMGFFYKGIEVDVVEIDPKTVDVAAEYFDFEPSLVNIDFQDARMAVRRCNKKYDIIAIDLFNGDGIPEHLVTREFFTDILQCLSAEGILVMNSFSDPENNLSKMALLKTITSVMGSVLAMSPDNAKGGGLINSFFVARNSGSIEKLNILTNDAPPKIEKMLLENIKNMRVYDRNSQELANIPVLSDASNSWKMIIRSAEVKYRKQIIANMPRQILVN